MSSRPFRFSDDLANSGAIKEFLLSEEDYLAYRAGLYMSNALKGESGTLIDSNTAQLGTNLVGTSSL